jgi:hypothetical protein
MQSSPVHTTSSQVAEARRAAWRWRAALGFDETAPARSPSWSPRPATNLVKHAGAAAARCSRHPLRRDGGAAGIEILAIDRGPGMANVGRACATATPPRAAPGTGLGAMRRLADDFDVYSQPGQARVLLCPAVGGAGEAASPTATSAPSACPKPARP